MVLDTDSVHELSEDDVKGMVDNIEQTGEAAPPKKEQAPYTDEKFQLIFDHPDKLMGHRLKYQANGKEVEEDIATILKRASAGYNYAQSVNQLKAQQAQLEERAKMAQGIEEKWSKFEKYAKENPAWYDHWSQAWEKRGSVGTAVQSGDTTGIDERLTSLLEQKLGPIQQFIENQQRAQADAEAREYDKKLETGIQATRKKHPSIDFDASDPETGKTLEYQVLEFAHKNNIYDFGTAFKVYYHDKLVASELEQAKVNWAKEQEQATRKGILGESKPKTEGKSYSSKGSTWDQVAEHAARVLGFND